MHIYVCSREIMSFMKSLCNLLRCVLTKCAYQVWKESMEICGQDSKSFCRYNLQRQCYMPAKVKLYKKTNEEIKSVTKTFLEVRTHSLVSGRCSWTIKWVIFRFVLWIHILSISYPQVNVIRSKRLVNIVADSTEPFPEKFSMVSCHIHSNGSGHDNGCDIIILVDTYWNYVISGDVGSFEEKKISPQLINSLWPSDAYPWVN